ncbi:hypothetical protein CASFOL_012225 [Castilleja foliolosa]|uniref:Transposase n=1 Tax=Castilleja foliolosa TaxID=1961234 RepID=A0ABD3DPR8_9LAMI
MDKSWMHERRFSKEYVNGVDDFIQFVESHMGKECDVRCPCTRCLNLIIKDQISVKQHIMINGIDPGYDTWFYHGESTSHSVVGDDQTDQEPTYDREEEDEDDGVNDILFNLHEQYTQSDTNGVDNTNDGGVPTYLEDLIRGARTELYPGCKKISRTSFIIQLLHLKVYNKLSNKTVDMILQLMKSSFPDGETLPGSYYEAKKFLRDLGLGYECIHACKYDCALYWKENKKLEACPICQTSRWKLNDGVGKKIPHKILRYFPLKPRLQRLFMSEKTSKKMVWHNEKRVNDEYMRHPADSAAWKDFDKEFPQFAEDPRNVRLALATDGFNPFGNMSTSYSMWPVILAPLNLPPWDCMKDPFLFLSLLIPGKNSPGKDIDVYLRPLVDELKELFTEGADTFDFSVKKTFRMHASVLWTINDFPAYGDLSGWITKGYMACPSCNEETYSVRLHNKISYMGHRRNLPIHHPWRKDKKNFNGQREDSVPPKSLTGDDVLLQLNRLQTRVSGKHDSNKKRKRGAEELNWTKRSILFELPYWSKLKLRHNLDVMHIEKNICESILGTLMNVEGKTKDTAKARLDLEDMKIRKELHLINKGNGKYAMPPASYVMTTKERRDFCDFIRSVKFPDGYASNIARCVTSNDQKLSGMKSHDCHVILQRILPVGIRGSVTKEVREVLTELGHFFQNLCCKKLNKTELEKMKEDICLIMCKLEKIYPPAFFDVMVHLSIHLPEEAILGGPVQFRWMYPIERFLCGLKQSVRNKARPEGSVAEAYIAKECLTFCSMYLKGIENRFNRDDRNNDIELEDSLPIFSQKCRPVGSTTYLNLSVEELKPLTWFVFQNCEEVEPFLEKHKEELVLEGCMNLEQEHKEKFPEWFKKHIIGLYNADPSGRNESLYSLACAPSRCIKKFSGCIVNGVRFLTKDRDSRRKTQNSGVVVDANHGDNTIAFYGVLDDIIQLDYVRDRRVILFKCDWFDLGRKKLTRIKKEGNIVSVRVDGKWYEEDSYILADQARQVFYINDPKLGHDWRVVIPVSHRHVYDVSEMINEEIDDDVLFVENGVYQENDTNDVLEVNLDEIESLRRNDLDPDDIDATLYQGVPRMGDVANIDDVEDLDDTMVDYNSSEEGSEKSHNSDYDSDSDAG